MDKLASQQIKLVSWPSPQDYNEAMQNLSSNVSDPVLRQCHVQTGKHSLPVPRTGAFASVYKLTAGGQNWALRCFLRNVPDNAQRYAAIGRFIHNDSLACTVDFEYLEKGIRILDRWYPAVKMQWADGETLDNAVRLREGRIELSLAEKFRQVCKELEAAGVAHGDLQHGNILINDGELLLVDYDGFYVPEMKGWKAAELGHRNYQHPQRTAETFGPYLDRFAAWNIYTSLVAMSLCPQLYHELGECEDSLLFRREDFVDPLNSPAFSALESCGEPRVVQLALFVRWQVMACTPDKIPSVSDEPPEQLDLPPLNPGVPRVRCNASPVVNSPVIAPVVVAGRGPVSSTIGGAPTSSGELVGASSDNVLHTTGTVEPELLKFPRKLYTPWSTAEVNLSWVLIGLLFLCPITWVLRSDAFMAWFFLSPILFYLLMRVFFFFDEKETFLLRNGTATRGRIVKVEKADAIDKLIVTYQYWHHNQKQIIESKTTIPKNRLSHTGTEATVVYDPDFRDSSLIYQFADRRVKP